MSIKLKEISQSNHLTEEEKRFLCRISGFIGYSVTMEKQYYKGKLLKLAIFNHKELPKIVKPFHELQNEILKLSFDQPLEKTSKVKFLWTTPQSIISDNIVNLLTKILNIYPLSRGIMMQSLIKKFPHHTQKEHILNIFVYQSLKLLIDYPPLCEDILSLIIQKMLKLDSEIKDTDIIKSFSSIKTLNETHDSSSSKLDSLMYLLFDFLHLLDSKSESESEFFSNRRENIGCLSEKIFSCLIEIFQRDVLNTFQPKIIQFIYFFACKFKPFSEKFCSLLICNSFSKIKCHKYKIISLCYLISLLFKSKFLNKNLIKTVMEYLLTFEETKINEWKKYLRKEIKNGKEIEAIIESNFDQNLIMYVIFEGLLSIVTYRIDFGSPFFEEIYIRMKNIVRNGNESLFFFSHLHDKLHRDFYTLCREHNYSEFSSLIMNYGEERNNSKIKKESNQSLTFMPFEPNFLLNSRKFLSEIYCFEIKVKRSLSLMKSKLTPSTHEGYSETLSNVSVNNSEEGSITLSGTPMKKRKLK